MLVMKFLFCIILFVGMVNAENFSRIMKLKNEIVEKAEFARQAIKEKLSEFTGPITRGIANIKSEADKVKNTVYYQIDGAQKVEKAKIDNVLKDASESNVKKCSDISKTMMSIVPAICQEVMNCISGLVNEAINNWNKILNRVRESLENLMKTENDAEICVKNIDSWQSAAYASVCLAKVAAKGTIETATNVPILLADIGNLYLKIESFVPQLQICVTMKGIQKVKEVAGNVLENVVACVRNKTPEKWEKSSYNSILSWVKL